MNDRSDPVRWAEVTDLGDGIWAVDTGFKRPLFDASHLDRRDGRAAFVDVATSYSVPRLLAALGDRGLTPEDVDYVILTHVHLDHGGGAGALLRHLPAAKLVVHPRGARHMIDPSALMEGASAVFGEESVRRVYGEVCRWTRARVIEAPDGLHPRAQRPAAPFPRHPGPRPSPRLHLGRGRRAPSSPATPSAWPTPSSRPIAGPSSSPPRPPSSSTPTPWRRRSTGCWRRTRGAMLLTHYSRVTDVERLAGVLLEQVRALVEMGRAADGRSDRAAHLRAALGEYFVGRAVDHGCSQPLDELREFLAHDVELNAQGLEVWLDKAKR